MLQFVLPFFFLKHKFQLLFEKSLYKGRDLKDYFSSSRNSKGRIWGSIFLLVIIGNDGVIEEKKEGVTVECLSYYSL